MKEIDCEKGNFLTMEEYYKKDENIESLIFTIVCKHFDVSKEILISKTRKEKVCLPRQITQYFLSIYTDYGLKKVAQTVGLKDHSTVINSINAVDNLIDTDEVIRGNIFEIKEKIEKKIDSCE